MEAKINIANLLKDSPKGMELDCTMIDNVVFEKLDVRSSHHPIIIRRTDSKDSNTTIHLTKYGQYSDEEDYKCVIFPKGKTTWEGFIPPIQPKFKAGDKVKRKDADYTYIVTIAKLDDDYYDYVNEDGQCGVIHISTQDDWELVPNKFDITTLKPFDKVLVRDNNEQFWTCDWFSFHDTKQVYPFACVGHYVSQCIPYEGNEHLLGTTNDCDEYFKTW